MGRGGQQNGDDDEDEGHSRSSRLGMAFRSSKSFLQIIYIAIIHSKNNLVAHRHTGHLLKSSRFFFFPHPALCSPSP